MSQKYRLSSWLYKFNLCCNSLILISLTQAISVSAEEINVIESGKLFNQAQTPANPTPRRETKPPSTQPLPEQAPPAPLPPPEQLLTPPVPNTLPSNLEEEQSDDIPQAIAIKKIKITGSTIFSEKDFAKITERYTKKPVSLAELFQLRSEITKFYVDKGYITTGAFIPPQKLIDGVVEVRIIEGELEEIKVSGTGRLNPNYVRSRLALATRKPLNREKLLEALQVLQLNPLIKNLSAELAAGIRPGSSTLEVTIQEAKTFNAQITLDNSRSPSVGSFRRQVQLSESNLLGLGDSISAAYTNTDGSNSYDFNYTVPINPRNGTFAFSYGTSDNNVIEQPFNRLDIESNSNYYEFTLRQPVIQKPNRELAFGVALTNRESQASLLNGEVPFPGEGVDKNGRTSVTALRLFQEWTQRSSKQVFAVRSQFSIGLDAFNSTINNKSPDSSFYAWRGQAQWVRLLAPDTLLLIRGDLQFADRPLVALEQFGLGGQSSVRGYRQDALLTDNGFFVSSEVRLPLLRDKRSQTLLQIVPFIDVGTVWNRSNRANLETNTLLSTGLGLRLQLSDKLNAQFDWGIPLISFDSRKSTWQENGLYFSVVYTPF
ncbi:MAG: ShlB/FhaC/HecB family hemolysin secretion/activation protein [Methylacidiphilales bacterium]|nr:ShlB/FhaC/HecB family hemolysin secretion/activation protein [Candidatus Methylacidiphilales bacterium]NJR16840.1 ShlB/FhaC/HecB family hemolysin secretion/activation protein [Calothrix sp. CSU_2_0]